MTWAQKQTMRGFTIVELLIVVVVIAILAAITIVAYNGIQNRTYDSIVQNELSSFYKKMENYKSQNSSDAYPTPGSTANMSAITSSPDVNFKFTQDAYSTSISNNIAYCYATNGSEMAVVARSRSNNAFIISSTSKRVEPYTPAWTNAAATTCRNSSQLALTTADYANVWARTSGTWNYGN